MSWIDKLQSPIQITTGDGRQYTPLWMPTSKSVEYNLAEFEFDGVSGTLVKRKLPKGRKIPLRIFFQGEDHLDQAAAFELSSADERPWTLLHPFYGSLTVQPVSLNFDNTAYNITEITGTLIETITEDNPRLRTDPRDTIVQKKEDADLAFNNGFDVTPDRSDINTMTDTNNKMYELGNKFITVLEQAQDYYNTFQTANAAVNNATSQASIAMKAVQSLINAPALFVQSVQSRVGVMSSQFSSLRGTLKNITGKSSKRIYEFTGGSLISAQALAAADSNESDYSNTTEVLDVIETINSNYIQYINDLDGMQSDNGGDPESYIPDPDSIRLMNSMVNYTISKLYDIALNSKRERSILLEDDSNIIIVTHRLYGLDPLDVNIDTIIKNNNIGINELVQLRKGRKIVYYI